MSSAKRARSRPERLVDGALATYTAHERFANPKGLRLNPHGTGPFVRLRLGRLSRTSGVYAVVTQDKTVLYVGVAGELLVRHVWIVLEGAQGFHDVDPATALASPRLASRPHAAASKVAVL